MSVRSTHPEYDANIDRWSLVRDVVNSDVKQHIPDIDINDPARSKRYREDARFTNFTGRTKNGLVGAIFMKDVEIDLPESIDYLEDDATGSKIGLKRLAQEITGEVLQAGRYGLLVDYPTSAQGLTKADIMRLGLKARISKYMAESIINWNADYINGSFQLNLVVLAESVSVLGEDGFTWIHEDQYRVLRLVPLNNDEDEFVKHVYVQQIYNEQEELVSEALPVDFSGNTWEFIPFIFVGSEDNDTDVDASPLYDLAELNIGHLRNSADYEESVHIIGQPTLVLSTDMTPEQFQAANPNGVQIGARRGLNLGPGGNATMLQATPNQLADEAMKRKEDQAVMIGARLITPVAGNQTAEEARIKHSGENSVLSIIANNVESAIREAISYIMRFMSNEEYDKDTVIFNLSDQFFDTGADPQLIAAQIQLYNNGLIAAKDVRDSLRKTGAISQDRTDDDIEADLLITNPLVGASAFNNFDQSQPETQADVEDVNDTNIP